jgi:hypothetical protein
MTHFYFCSLPPAVRNRECACKDKAPPISSKRAHHELYATQQQQREFLTATKTPSGPPSLGFSSGREAVAIILFFAFVGWGSGKLN